MTLTQYKWNDKDIGGKSSLKDLTGKAIDILWDKIMTREDFKKYIEMTIDEGSEQ